MRAVAAMLEQDLKLLLRNALFWVMAATLVLVILTVNLIPGDVSPATADLVVHGFEGGIPGAVSLGRAAEVESHVRATGGVGAVRRGDQLTVVHTGLGDRAAAALAMLLSAPGEPAPAVATVVLRPGAGAVTRSLQVTPVAITFEAIVLGFLMAAVLMLAERQERVLDAYRVSPGRPLTYVASKTLLFTGLGTLYAAAMAVSTVGFAFDWLGFAVLAVLASALYTLLGLALTVFFRDISGWFVVAMVVLGINMLPMVSHAVPTFAPAWLAAIPSYSIVFAFDEILFPTGKGLAGTFLVLGAWTVAALVLCTALVERRLLTAR